MMDFAKLWFSGLSSQTKTIMLVTLAVFLLGAGIYDARETAKTNEVRVHQLKDSVQHINRDLQRLSKDMDNILCILVQKDEDDPLVCLEERRLNQLRRR